MKLLHAWKEKDLWIKKGYIVPSYDRPAMIENTKEAPIWVHFGSGNIFRSFFAPVQDILLGKGLSSKGIVVVGRKESEEIEAAYWPNDNMSVFASLKADGQMDKYVVGSVADALSVGEDKKGEGWDRLLKVFEAPSLQMVSFTITEKGYAGLHDGSVMDQAATALYHRYQNGAFPVAMVSQDNCSQNGQKLLDAITAISEKKVAEGTFDKDFLSYISDKNKVSFPWSMVDKITPRPDVRIAERLEADGAENMAPFVTPANTYTAAFVNGEETQYWVVEDWFPNGRPPLENAGILFTDRDTVEQTERMKVCTCLNPLHTALAIFGCLLSYDSISAEMKDKDLVRLVNRLGFVEGMPVVTDPGILSPEEFIKQVLDARFPNPFIPDTPQRIASDTSQKLSIRFGETIKEYMAGANGGVKTLQAIPVVLAGWCRYLMSINDEGEAFQMSDDPRLEEVSAYVKDIKLGDTGPFYAQLDPLFHDVSIFGVDLYEAGLADEVHAAFVKLVSGKGSVRKVLEELN